MAAFAAQPLARTQRVSPPPRRAPLAVAAAPTKTPRRTTRKQTDSPLPHTTPRAATTPPEVLGELVRARVTSRAWFDNAITFCILLVALATGVSVSFVHVEDRSTVPHWATLFPSLVAPITLAVFTLEVCRTGVSHKDPSLSN